MTPLFKNQPVTLTIQELAPGGEGLAKVDGYPVFVPHAFVGDVVVANPINVHKSYARALIKTMETRSPHRVVPPCQITKLCGGCPIMALDYPEQLRTKQHWVGEQLRRIGHLEDPTILDIIASPKPFAYRHKVQFVVGQKGQTPMVHLGYFAPKSHNLVGVPHCAIHAPVFDTLLKVSRDVFSRLGLRAYNEITGKGHIRHVVGRLSGDGKRLVVMIVATQPKLSQAQVIIDSFRKAMPELTGLCVNVNTGNGNRILGDATHVLWGDPVLQESIAIPEKATPLKVSLSPGSFYQVNQSVLPALLATMAQAVGDATGKTVLDAYCGVGIMGLYLASLPQGSPQKLIGIEHVPNAIDNARLNATQNGITNAEFFVGNVEERLELLETANIVVLDPPRTGCKPEILEAFCNTTSIERIVYVSCNPATLARDIALLAEHFTLEWVQPLDMFPHTAHVESVAVLTRKQQA